MKTDDRDHSHLEVVPGDRPDDAKPRAWRRKSLDEAEQVTCWQCERDTGVATSAVIEITIAPRRSPAGKLIVGTKAWVCAYCLCRGKITKLIV